MALSVRGLRKAFGAKLAVAGIDLDIPHGCFFGLVGPNGAGKTTTLGMVTGLLRPDAGSVAVDGVDVWRSPPDANRRIGVLPEDLRLFDRLSGQELLTYNGLLRGMPAATVAERSRELLDVLDLRGAAGTLVVDYSHGMRKKIALAAALLHNPRVLFLALAWALLPLLTFAADSALDPAKLVLLPLRPRQLATGLFVASCVGLPPLATLAALSGAVVGFGPAGPGLIVVVSLGALTLNLGVQVLVRSTRPSRLADLDWLRSLGRALGWLPPGLAARAMATAGRGGSLPVAALELGGAAVAVLLLAWWWYASLRRVLTTVEPSGGPRRVSKAAVGLFPRPIRRLLPLDRRGAVAAKDLRYFARHPRLRVLWLTAALFAVILPGF